MNLSKNAWHMQQALCVQGIRHNLTPFLYQGNLNLNKLRRFEKISDNLMHQLRDASKDFLWYCLTGLKYQCIETAQLLVCIRGINPRFELNEEWISVEPLKETTTDQDLFNAVENCVEITGLVWNKMASVITDGAHALTEKCSMNSKITEYHPDHTLLPL